MNDYERIARVIRYLDAHHTEQPNLATLANSAGLSQFHFHRLFSSWAGVTPKDFLQCLTLEHVKTLLQERESVLKVALDAGLSGPGRLHDLCVSLEAASPGEIKSGGEGLKIVFGFADSPFGKCLVAESQRGICHLSFVEDETVTDLRSEWPNAQFEKDEERTAQLADQIFSRSHRREEVESDDCSSRHPTASSRRRLPTSVTLRGYVKGTAFQLRVWRALLRVPAGQLVTYGRLAAAIQQPTAARAVGSAVGQNPLAFLIPCHRVIQETGVVGGYRWDPVRKQAIIAWETTPRRAILSTMPRSSASPLPGRLESRTQTPSPLCT